MHDPLSPSWPELAPKEAEAGGLALSHQGQRSTLASGTLQAGKAVGRPSLLHTGAGWGLDTQRPGAALPDLL